MNMPEFQNNLQPPKQINNELTALPSPDKQPGLEPITPKKPIQPVTPPQKNFTLDDFLKEADKISRRRAQLAAQPVLEEFKKGSEQFASKLFGQGVGASSGVGGQLSERALESFGKRLEPIAERATLEAQQQELDFRRDKALREEQRAQDLINQQFQLVQSGQISGDQAEDVLRQQGINPETYMTQEQLIAKQEQQAFQEKLDKTIKDPQVKLLIDTPEELEFYFEYGKTFEDEVADIVETSKSLSDWKGRMPELEKSLSVIEDKIEKESEGFFGFFVDDKKVARLQEQRQAIIEAINDIKAGKTPSAEAGTAIDRPEKTKEKPKKQTSLEPLQTPSGSKEIRTPVI